MDNPAAVYHVARDGQVIGAFSFPTLAEAFKVGSVLPTDHYIIEGEADWKLVEELKSAFAKHEKELIRAEKERLKAEQERIAAREKQRKEAEELRKREEEIKKANEERAQRIATAERERREAERRKAIAWTCGTCSKKFADPKRTGDGKREIDASLLYFIGFTVCCFIAWQLLKASFGAAFESSRSGNSADGYAFGFYLFLALALALAWASARDLIIGGAAKGLDTYHGRQSSCPHCGSSNFAETKFD